jgi:CheY-like chemotaxis protein
MAAPPRAPFPDIGGLTLLVVDDDNDSLEVLGDYLHACGAHVLQARNAAGALAYIDTTPRLDAVITDIAMPQMNGLEFVRKIREHPSRRSLPVIALTAFYEHYPSTTEFDAYLRKPVDLDRLGLTIRVLTERRGPHR